MNTPLSRRRFLAQGASLTALGILPSGCAFFARDPAYVAFLGKLFGLEYMMILAAGYTLPIVATQVLIYRRVGYNDWDVLRDTAIIAMLVTGFNGGYDEEEYDDYYDEVVWTPISWAVAVMLLRTSLGRFGRGEHDSF